MPEEKADSSTPRQREAELMSTLKSGKPFPFALFFNFISSIPSLCSPSSLFYKTQPPFRFPNSNYSTLFSFLMEDIHMHQFPAFGDWDMNGHMPITQYFESARQAGLHRKLPADEPVWDLYAPVPTIYRFKGRERVKRVQNVKETWKQGRVCHVAEGPMATSAIPAPVRAPKAVDEDLYKIPSELLRKNRRRRLKLLSFISSMFRRRRICY